MTKEQTPQTPEAPEAQPSNAVLLDLLHRIIAQNAGHSEALLALLESANRQKNAIRNTQLHVQALNRLAERQTAAIEQAVDSSNKSIRVLNDNTSALDDMSIILVILLFFGSSGAMYAIGANLWPNWNNLITAAVAGAVLSLSVVAYVRAVARELFEY